MKRPHCCATGLMILFIGAPSALAQAVKPLETLPLEVRTSEQLSDVYKKEIQTYISGWVSVLSDESSPKQQSAARDKLVTAATALGAQNASVAYQDFYAASLDKDLMPLVHSKQMRLRLLAGIVAGRVASRVNNAALADVALALIKDPSDPVVIWGMKTARYVMPSILQNASTHSALVQAIVPAVADHPAAPLANDAYQAFALPAGTPAGAMVAAAQQTIDLINARIKLYQKMLPFDATADSIGTTFLSIRAWKLLNSSQQFQAVQAISSLIGVMAERATAIDQSQVPELSDGLQPVAAAVYVIGGAENAAGVVNAAKALAQKQLNSQTTGADIQALADPIYPALKAVPQFAALQPPPKLESATTEPTTHVK